jgi:autonomous glycyl radical cofactor GrcA
MAEKEADKGQQMKSCIAMDMIEYSGYAVKFVSINNKRQKDNLYCVSLVGENYD